MSIIKLSSLLLIKEVRSASISKEDVLNKLNSDYTSALAKYKKGYAIYRGIKYTTDGIYHADDSPGLFKFVQPSLSYRKSANTSNFYTALIDILPSWKDWPKRSKSIICSSSQYIAQGFGRVYIVFPKNGAKIGICSKPDFWSSFPYINSRLEVYDMDVFNDQFYYVFTSVFKNNFYKQLEKNIKLFFDDANKLVRIEQIKLSKDNIYESVYNDLINNFKGNWIEYFDNLLDPIKNDFKLTTIENYDLIDGTRKEVWTDADSVLTSGSYNID